MGEGRRDEGRHEESLRRRARLCQPPANGCEETYLIKAAGWGRGLGLLVCSRQPGPRPVGSPRIVPGKQHGHILAWPGNHLRFMPTMLQYPEIGHFYLWGVESSDEGVQYGMSVH